jgi:hypothetical protein
MTKALAATAFLLLSVQLAWADCAELNRQALPKQAAFKAATDEYKNSTASHLRDLINNKEQPEIVAIAEGIVETSKMIAAMDDTIGYLHTVMDAGSFGKDASSWAAAIAKFESQRTGMRKDRRLYIDTLSFMANVEDKRNK